MYQFQGQSKISHHWVDLDPGWIEEKSMTRETDFFKRLYLKLIPGQTNKYWFAFSVTIGSAKINKSNSI